MRWRAWPSASPRPGRPAPAAGPWPAPAQPRPGPQTPPTPRPGRKRAPGAPPPGPGAAGGSPRAPARGDAKAGWDTEADGMAAPSPPAPVTASPVTASPAGDGPARAASPVAEAVAFAGADAITYALARVLPRGPVRVDARLAAAHHLGNPAYAVQYAHAHAASALRQAADLGRGRGEAAGFQPHLLVHPSEQILLNKLSWLPERVGGAARRARPDVLTHCLEGLARAYFDAQETCPAVRPGMAVPEGLGRSPAERAAVQAAAARLWLATAARTALGAGLGLLGMGAPDR